MRLTIGIILLIMFGCTMSNKHRIPMSYLNSIKETKEFTENLKDDGIDSIITYHKKHGFYGRDYYVFWIKADELELRYINSTGIFKLNSWDMCGLFRDKRIFEFFFKMKGDLFNQKIPELNWSHCPYSEINVSINESNEKFHLPMGVSSESDGVHYHFARLIEGIIFNIENRSYWIEAEKKVKYYPKEYDSSKEKWKEWEQNKISSGEIWDDYFH